MSVQDQLSKMIPTPFSVLLSNDGADQTGTHVSIGGQFNSILTPVDMWVELADLSDDLYTLITNIVLTIPIVDAPVVEGDFGDRVGGLTNGFRFWYEDDATARTYLTGLIKTNQDAQLHIGKMSVFMLSAYNIWAFEKELYKTSKGFLGSGSLNGKFGVTIAESDTPSPGLLSGSTIAVSGLTLNNPEKYQI